MTKIMKTSNKRISRTYGKINFKEGYWILNEIEPHVSIRLKKIFPKIPSYQISPFKIKSTPEIDNELEWFMQRYPLLITKADLNKLNDGSKIYNQNIEMMDKILLPTFEIKEKNSHFIYKDKQPRQYQWQMAELATIKQISLCGDVMGLGKTITGIATISLNAHKGLSIVVVPTHLINQWKNKIEEFTNFKVHIIKKGTPYNLPKADIFIFKYGLIKGWTDIFAQNIFYTAIFDEVQELRTGLATQKGSAAKVLCEHTTIKLGMSGTPVYNYGGEIWNIYNIFQEDLLGNEWEFQREWCSSLGNGKYKVNDPEALGRYLREQHLLIRRTKKDVGIQLGKVSRIIETVDYDTVKVNNFEALAKKLAITASTGSFIERGSASRELDMMARQITGISKAKSVAEMTRMLIESGESVLLSGWHREVYKIWLDELEEFNPVMYTGSESIKQKEQSKEDFLSKKSRVMIISNRSGAGLDGLQEICSTLIIGELDWSPKTHEQLEQRLDRDGQKNPVMILYPVSDEGSDPVIMDLCGLKNSQANGILDLYQNDISYGSDESRIKKLVDYYLNKPTKKVTYSLKEKKSMYNDYKIANLSKGKIPLNFNDWEA
ncbi:DEAD/DEAH box helicase [Aliarcobacter butzleri]|uniref:DEAD/DEAH box helicase n=1 Tax=Aliarcobacter butzleri TaxID=28197 RepID=UPI002B241741|nr:DEAD/DEAH box helicase [Aliarcobacter butzleri]